MIPYFRSIPVILRVMAAIIFFVVRVGAIRDSRNNEFPGKRIEISYVPQIKDDCLRLKMVLAIKK